MTEGEARKHCRDRDHSLCKVPGCAELARHLHHIIYRSHLAKADYWNTANLVSLCVAHHALVHSGALQISGDADKALEITGDDFAFVALACDGTECSPPTFGTERSHHAGLRSVHRAEADPERS